MREWWKKVCGPNMGENKAQNRFLLISWAVLSFIGIILPENVLSISPGTKAFTDVMAAVVPQIDRVTRIGLLPEINRLHYSLLWAVSPLYLVMYLFTANANLMLGRIKMPGWRVAFTLVGLVVIVYMVVYQFIDNPSERVTSLIYGQTVWRSIYAPIAVIGVMMSFAGFSIITKGLILGKLPTKSEAKSHGE